MTWSSSRSRNGGRPTHVRRGVSCRSGWCTSGRRSPARLRPVRASRSGSRPRRRRLCSTRCSPERGKRREAGDFTTALVGQFEAAAAAGGAAVASAVAAGETCAGLWGRGLALADVQPRNRGDGRPPRATCSSLVSELGAERPRRHRCGRTASRRAPVRLSSWARRLEKRRSRWAPPGTQSVQRL